MAALKSVPPSGTSPGFSLHESEVDRARYAALASSTRDVAVTLFDCSAKADKQDVTRPEYVYLFFFCCIVLLSCLDVSR